MKKLVRGEKGYVLIAALVVLLVLGLVSGPLLSFMVSGLGAGHVVETGADELYAADAGVEDAVLRIPTLGLGMSPECRSWTNPSPLIVNGKNVSVTVELQDDGTYKVTSTAITEGGSNTAGFDSSTTVESYVQYTPAIPPEEPVFLFDNAIRSDTTLYSSMATWVTAYPTLLSGKLHGNIITGGLYTLSGTIYGDVTVPTAGDLKGDPAKVIQGSVYYAPYSAPAAPDISPYETQAMAAENATLVLPASSYNNGGTITGSARLSGNLALASGKTLTVNGDLYIEGYVTMAGTSTLTVSGALYVGSYINANATSKLNFGGTSYVNGYMTLGKSNISEVSYVVIAEGNITFGALDNGCYALINGIYGKYDGKGGFKGLTSAEDAYLSGPHSIIMSETGSITTIDKDNVEIGGFLCAPAGDIITYHFFRLIGAMSGHSVVIKDIRQIYAGFPVGSPDSGSEGSPASLTILTWDIH